jgi:hypothetical protein
MAVINRRSSSTEHSNSNNSTTENLVSRRMSDPPSLVIETRNSTRSSSPLVRKIQSPTRSNIADSISTLLLPAPVRAYTRTRWRTVRTCILLLKILSLSRVCQPAYPIMWMQTFALALAVYDVWQEGVGEGVGDLRITSALAIAHVLILAVIRWRRNALCAI